MKKKPMMSLRFRKNKISNLNAIVVGGMPPPPPGSNTCRKQTTYLTCGVITCNHTCIQTCF
ncbi:MAG: hypothetical protein AAF617_08485 [Bacteroidota bacterium]